MSARPVIDQADCILYDGEGPKPQEIHFQEPELLKRRHRVLRCNGSVLSAGERYILYCRPAGNHNAGGMHGCIPGKSLQAPGHVDQVTRGFILLILAGKIRILLQSLVQCDVQFLRDHLCDAVALAVWHIQRSAHIPDDAPRGHRTESHDLDDPVPAVFPDYIVDDLLSSLEAEIHIDIRHRDALRVQEALKEQIVADRVQFSDPERVRHDRTCRRATPRPHDDAVVLCKMDIVPDDQEIIHEAHAADRIELVFQALGEFRPLRAVCFTVFPAHALLAELIQILRRSFALRRIVSGDLPLAESNFNIAAFGDHFGIPDRFRNIRKKPVHFLPGFYVILSAFIAHAVFILHFFLGLYAQQYVMGIYVLGIRVMHIIGRHERNSRLLMHPDQHLVDMVLGRNAVVLKFKKIPALPENIQMVQRCLFCPFVVSGRNVPRNLPGQAGRQSYDAFMVTSEQFPVDPGLIIEALRKSGGHNPDQVGITCIVFRQKNQVIVSFVRNRIVPVKTAPRRNIDLAPEDRFDPLCEGLLIKIDASEHHSVIRDRRSRLAQFLHAGYIFLYFI